jgi:hypothetical protein
MVLANMDRKKSFQSTIPMSDACRSDVLVSYSDEERKFGKETNAIRTNRLKIRQRLSGAR